MQLGFRLLILKLQCLMAVEDGQDLVEYALIVCLIATFCVASTNALAHLVINAYTNIVSVFNATV